MSPSPKGPIRSPSKLPPTSRRKPFTITDSDLKSEEERVVRKKGVDLYRAMKCVFGFGPCPYYTSTWSAEYKIRITRRRIANAHMMDDWMTAARTRVKVESNLEGMCDTLVGAGHTIQKEKNEVSQRMVYLGILIDSNRMMVSFELAQCKGMAAQLKSYLVRIRNLRGLDGGTIRSVSGSLN